MDTIVKVMLVFFISLLSFSVGTFVGKQVSDSDHRRMALESEMRDGREVASQDGGEAKDAPKVSEKDVENLAEEFVNKEKGTDAKDGKATDETAAAGKDGNGDDYTNYKHGEKNGKDGAATKEASKETAATGKETSETSRAGKSMADIGTKVANSEPVSDGKAEERKPTSTLPGVANSTVGKFTVQVASYATEDEAKNNAAQLKSKGWEAFYIPAMIGGKTWYRVSVGIFNNHNSAQAFRKDFLKESGAKTAIVSKIVQ